MASGERRWASTRKSGMTVLGKVPKPINLPSQKLENNGVDPNVDLVPKGTHTWGSKPLNSPNVWATSSFSPPQSDGSIGSPNNTYGRTSSYGNSYGRPSSGGSSTRPSTAGSERSNEAVAIALGSNSRPSSASGILPSGQIPLSLNRPRSAETRPGISHLSRFSENSSDCNAWLSAGTSERLGVVTSKRCDFSLNSGDFPSLGSEKLSELKSLDQKSHGNSSCEEESRGQDIPTNMENLRRDHLDPQPPPQHYGSWYAHPVRPPERFSCMGNEAGGFYRPVGPPASYPVELYYHHPCAPPVRAVPTHVRPDASAPGHQPAPGEPSRYLPDAYLLHNPPGVHPVPSLYVPPAIYGSPYPFQNPGLEFGKFDALTDRNSLTVVESYDDDQAEKGSSTVMQSSTMEKSLLGNAHKQEQMSCKQIDESAVHRPEESADPAGGENTASLMEKVDSLNGKTRNANVRIVKKVDTSVEHIRRSRVHNTKEKVDGPARVKPGGFHVDESNKVLDTEKTSPEIVGSEEEAQVGNENVDIEAQRWKLKELARQRALQLQREEEERTREQKAKALAKLEELNMRSSAASSKQNPVSEAHKNGDDDDDHVRPGTPKTTNSDQQSLLPLVQVTSEDEKAAPVPDKVSFDGRQKAPAILEDPPVQPKKKNNRGLKYKHKNDVQQPPSGHVGKSDAEFGPEDGGAKPSGAAAEAPPVSVMEGGQAESRPCSKESPLKVVSSEWKAHPSRKQARNQNQNQKHQGSETVVWAPVKAVNKTGPSEEQPKNEASEFSDPSSEKNNPDLLHGGGGAKAKRAEMERYVPKPITKELLRDSLAPPKLESAPATGGDSTPAAYVSGNRNAGSARQSRRGKPQPHASWRQRGSGESPSHGTEDDTVPDPQSGVEKAPSEPRSSDDRNGESGTVQDHGLNRQRRQHHKAASGVDRVRYVPTHNNDVAETLPLGGDAMASPSFLSDHVKSHWLPKSQVRSQPSQDATGSKETEVQELNREVKASPEQSSGGKNRFPQKSYTYSGQDAAGRARREGRHFEHQKPASSQEKQDDAGTAARYGHQGRDHNRHGGPFYGPRHGAPIRARGE